MDLELRDITRENFYQICLLQVAPEQVNHVDSNSISLAEANFMAFPWYRGIYVNDAPVGFILVDANTKTGKFALWRLMLDESHQSKGFGRKAIQVLGSELTKEFSITKLFTSVVSGKGGPQRFYENCGFKVTGDLIEGREIELCLALDCQM